MYKTSVPVRMSPYYNQDTVLIELSRVKADRIFLVSRDEIMAKSFCGMPNKYRNAWLDMTGETLKTFARQIRAAIDRLFGGKKATGVNVLEVMQKLRNMDLPEQPADPSAVENLVFPMSQRFLADNAIPMAYGDDQMPAILFGQNAKYVDRSILKNGAILDAEAAQCLTGRGIDVGLLSMQECQANQEHYLGEDESVTLYSGVRFYNMVQNKRTQRLTTFA